jgi:hypothetical protein
VGVEDEAGDLVGFICNDWFGQERRERDIGESHLGGDAFGGGGGGDAGERVAGAEGRGARQQRAQVIEDVASVGEGVREAHRRYSRTYPALNAAPSKGWCETRHCMMRPGARKGAIRCNWNGVPSMQVSIAADPIADIRADARRDRGRAVPAQLWQCLADAWLRHREQRIASAVHRLGHEGVLEEYRHASRG